MYATTADELLLAFREDVHDDTTYAAGDDSMCLWTDREIYRYMTVALDRVARDTQGLNELLRLPIVAGVGVVALPRHVLEINNVRDVLRNRALVPANTNTHGYGMTDDYGLRMYGHSSIHDSSGQPRAYIRDLQSRALNLVPVPNEAGELELQCTVTIDEMMETGVDLPFYESTDLDLALEYMKYLGYRKQDAETEDLTRSQAALTMYKGGVPARKAELNNYRRTPGAVRMEWH